MKKVLVISMVMVFAAAMVVSAAPQWVAEIGAAPVAGSYAWSSVTEIGMIAGASNALTDDFTADLYLPASEAAATAPSLSPGAGVIIGSTGNGTDTYAAHYCDIRSNTAPQTWIVNVAGGNSYAGTANVVIKFGVAAGYLVNSDLGVNYTAFGTGTYTLKQGANTLWTAQGKDLAEGTVANINGLAQGNYTLTYTESAPVTPEPGSMLALGSGLVGLVGFAIRRRK